MELHVTPEQEAFIRHGIDAGRFHGKEDAVPSGDVDATALAGHVNPDVVKLGFRVGRKM